MWLASLAGPATGARSVRLATTLSSTSDGIVTTVARRSYPFFFSLPRATTAERASARPVVALWALVCAATLPTVLTAAWLVAGALQPPSYSPVKQTVSVLSGYAGNDRWIVTAALYVVGAGYLAAAVGMNFLHRASRIGLGVAGVAAVGVASFPEPAQGTSGAHAVCTGIGALTITVWPALASRQESVRDAVGRTATLVAMIVSTSLFVWTVGQTQHGTALGLAERTSAGLQACWPFVVALALRRRPTATDRENDDERPGVLDSGIDPLGYPQCASAVCGDVQPGE